MSLVDTLVLGTLAIGLTLGLIRGFISQATGLLGLVGGLILASRYHEGLRRIMLDPFVKTDHNGEIAFIGIVVFTVLTIALLGFLLGKLVESLDLGAYDRLMGGALGILKTGLICAAILLTVVYFAPNGGGIEKAISRSRAAPVLWKAMTSAAGVLPEKMRGEARKFLEDNALPAPPPADAKPPE